MRNARIPIPRWQYHRLNKASPVSRSYRGTTVAILNPSQTRTNKLNCFVKENTYIFIWHVREQEVFISQLFLVLVGTLSAGIQHASDIPRPQRLPIHRSTYVAQKQPFFYGIDGALALARHDKAVGRQFGLSVQRYVPIFLSSRKGVDGYLYVPSTTRGTVCQNEVSWLLQA